jgi:hypothetical protein
MPRKSTIARARRDQRSGKAPTTQAGEFVREEMDKVKRGSKRVKSRRQAVAIGLSMARRAGVDLPAPAKASSKTRKSAASARKRGQERGELATGSRRKAARRSATKTSSSGKKRSSTRSRRASSSRSRSRR